MSRQSAGEELSSKGEIANLSTGCASRNPDKKWFGTAAFLLLLKPGLTVSSHAAVLLSECRSNPNPLPAPSVRALCVVSEKRPRRPTQSTHSSNREPFEINAKALPLYHRSPSLKSTSSALRRAQTASVSTIDWSALTWEEKSLVLFRYTVL